MYWIEVAEFKISKRMILNFVLQKVKSFTQLKRDTTWEMKELNIRNKVALINPGKANVKKIIKLFGIYRLF